MNFSQLSSRQIILVTGAARSGKSEWAETLAVEMAKHVIYLATARENSQDSEWSQRISRHRQRRPKSWQTWNVDISLPETIINAGAHSCLLVDSLGTWVANLWEEEEKAWQTRVVRLLESLEKTPADVILVAEEVGWGVVPAYASGRQFRDRLGNLVRRIGVMANTVYLVTGGHALNLSLLGEPLKDHKL